MRIAYLTTIYPKTSHSFIRREILELERRGHSIERISIRRPEEPLLHEADRAESRRTFYLLARGAPKLLWAAFQEWLRDPLGMFEATRLAVQMSSGSERGLFRHLAYVVEAAYLRGHFRRHPVDHLHAHFGTNPAAVARLLERLAGPGYSFTIHGPDEWDAPRGFRLKEKIEQARFVVTISHHGRAQALRWADGAAAEKIHIVRSGLPAAIFERSVPVPPESRTLLFVGRLCPQKAPLILIEAFARLLEQGIRARLVVVGDGELRAATEARIEAHALGPHVELMGWLPEPSVVEQLRAARALVLPSLAEGLPTVLLEAFAQQRPVISSCVAGIPELVESGHSGWLVAPADIDALVHAMAEALRTDSRALDAMGRNGAARVRKHYDVATTVDPLEQLLMRAARTEP